MVLIYYLSGIGLQINVSLDVTFWRSCVHQVVTVAKIVYSADLSNHLLSLLRNVELFTVISLVLVFMLKVFSHFTSIIQTSLYFFLVCLAV